MAPSEMALCFTLPWPPSVNGYWRTFKNRQILSRRGREYRQEVGGLLAVQGFLRRDLAPLVGRLGMSLDLYPPDKRERDADNSPKAILDALQHAGLIENDSQIKRLTVTMHDDPELDPEPKKPGKVVIVLRKEARRGNV